MELGRMTWRDLHLRRRIVLLIVVVVTTDTELDTQLTTRELVKRCEKREDEPVHRLFNKAKNRELLSFVERVENVSECGVFDGSVARWVAPWTCWPRVAQQVPRDGQPILESVNSNGPKECLRQFPPLVFGVRPAD